MMGGCMSSNNEVALQKTQKKHSQAIDKQLEEDSKRLRRECKILLLGTELPGCCSRSMAGDGTDIAN